eukprot:2335234-Amphidinium_carterae.2
MEDPTQTDSEPMALGIGSSTFGGITGTWFDGWKKDIREASTHCSRTQLIKKHVNPQGHFTSNNCLSRLQKLRKPCFGFRVGSGKLWAQSLGGSELLKDQELVYNAHMRCTLIAAASVKAPPKPRISCGHKNYSPTLTSKVSRQSDIKRKSFETHSDRTYSLLGECSCRWHRRTMT